MLELWPDLVCALRKELEPQMQAARAVKPLLSSGCPELMQCLTHDSPSGFLTLLNSRIQVVPFVHAVQALFFRLVHS